MSSVALIDYGSGNLASAAKALARAADGKFDIVTTADPQVVLDAERVVLPGVGAFADCMKGLSAVPGMVEALREKVLKEGAPFLGICVGMQLLATVGVEFGRHAGLGWIAGEVVKITPDDPDSENSAHGLERAQDRTGAMPCWKASRRQPRLFRP